jgi:hypothetical protein
MPVINAHLAADLIVEGEQMPEFVWTMTTPRAACWSTPA